MKPAALILLLATSPQTALGQPEFADLRTVMTAGAGAAESSGSLRSPAVLWQRTSARVEIRRLYGLPELQPGFVAVGGPVAPRTSLSVGFSNLALEGFSRRSLSLRVAHGTAQRRIGIAFRAVTTRSGVYPGRTTLGIGGAAAWSVGRRWTLGLLVDPGLARSRTGARDPEFCVAASWRVDAKLDALVDLTRVPGEPARAILGVVWRPDPALEARFGWSDTPPVQSAGLLVHARGLSVELAFSRHDPLGWSSGAGVGWTW